MDPAGAIMTVTVMLIYLSPIMAKIYYTGMMAVMYLHRIMRQYLRPLTVQLRAVGQTLTMTAI